MLLPLVSLAEAREARLANQKPARAGGDPPAVTRRALGVPRLRAAPVGTLLSDGTPRYVGESVLEDAPHPPGRLGSPRPDTCRRQRTYTTAS